MSFDGRTVRSDNTAAERVKAPHRTALTVFIALGASIVIYTAIGFVILSVSGETSNRPALRVELTVAGLFLALGAVALRRTQLRATRLTAIAAIRGIDGLLKHLVLVTILSAAVAETIGIMGLLVSLFGGSRRDVGTLGVVALLVLVSGYPSRRAWERTIDYLLSTDSAPA
jgi:hypothetical protein